MSPNVKSSTKSTERVRHFHRLCVFCGASDSVDQLYLEAAKRMGAAMVSNNIKLAYGGGTTGLMGAMAREVVAGLGESGVLGVIPHALTPREVSGEMIGETIMVNDMHTRKALMAKHADGFISMPGGFGTLEELMEVLTWQQLGFHEKPIGLLNINGFFDPLLEFFNTLVAKGFLKEQHNCILVSEDPDELIDMLRHFRPPRNLIQCRMASMEVLGEDLTYESDSSSSSEAEREKPAKVVAGIDISKLNIAGGPAPLCRSVSPYSSPYMGTLAQTVRD